MRQVLDKTDKNNRVPYSVWIQRTEQNCPGRAELGGKKPQKNFLTSSSRPECLPASLNASACPSHRASGHNDRAGS